MNCMKCGRETEKGNAFCPVCMERMRQYPVRPGTAVVLPSRKEPQPVRKQAPRKRTLSSEEQINLLKKHNQRLAYILIILVLLLMAMGATCGLVVREIGMLKLIGQNYSTITQTDFSESSTVETVFGTDFSAG